MKSPLRDTQVGRFRVGAQTSLDTFRTHTTDRCVLAAVLVVVGAMNCGLVGLFQLDLVATIFGDASLLSRIVYSLVGFAGSFQALQWEGIQRRRSMTPAMMRQ